MKIRFSSQKRELLLFLTTNMAAVTSRANQQYCECLSDLRLSTSEICATQLLSVTEIAPKSLFLCVNSSPVRYGLSACAKAIRDSVNMALFTHLSQTLWNDIIYFRQQYKRYTVT